MLGALEAGETVVAIVALVALALGFLGLLHTLIEGVVGEPGKRRRASGRTERRVAILGTTLTAGLLALSAVAVVLPESALVEGLL